MNNLTKIIEEARAKMYIAVRAALAKPNNWDTERAAGMTALGLLAQCTSREAAEELLVSNAVKLTLLMEYIIEQHKNANIQTVKE